MTPQETHSAGFFYGGARGVTPGAPARRGTDYEKTPAFAPPAGGLWAL